MLLQDILSPLAFLPLIRCAPLSTQLPLEPPSAFESTYRVPTRYESTVLGRRLLALSTTGVISTIFPSNNESSASRTSPDNKTDDNDNNNDNDNDDPTNILRLTPPPASVASLSISLPDYLSDCDQPSHGNPTLLFLDPSTSSRNSRSSHSPHSNHPTNISLSLSWWDQYPLLTGHKPWAPADLPRLSMIGYLEEISIEEAEESGVVECYLKGHPDARLWLPGDKHAAHGGRWVRLVVQEVYWMGGFGDKHWIGWFDVREWRGVEKAEWEGVRLPGEKA